MLLMYNNDTGIPVFTPYHIIVRLLLPKSKTKQKQELLANIDNLDNDFNKLEIEIENKINALNPELLPVALEQIDAFL